MKFRCQECIAPIDPGALLVVVSDQLVSDQLVGRRVSRYVTCSCGTITCFGAREGWKRWYAIAYKPKSAVSFFPLREAKAFYRRVGTVVGL